METQITLRLSSDLARRLSRQAKTRGTKKSQLVREAVAQYLERAEGETPDQLWARLEPFIGSVEGDLDALNSDPIARQIYQHNVRD